MSSAANITEVKEKLETIFSHANDYLEKLIERYQQLLLKDPIDPLRERIFAFCSELMSLRNKINDKSQPLSVRIESVGNVATYIDDLAAGVGEYAKNEDEMHSSKLIYIIDEIESSMGIDTGPELSMAETAILENPQVPDSYFKAKKTELDAIVRQYPELTQ
ncbi:MAG: hypothetical protein P4M14_12170 [Gammaproteobacteria bacterium]|nr:hypothetical protein [Gammaproteobacteria bacterium]